MTEAKSEKNLLVQSQFPPIEDMGLVETHFKLADNNVAWNSVGILMDQEEANQLILLLNNISPVSVFRICLSEEESLAAIKLFQRGSGEVFLGYYQGKTLTSAQITSLDTLEIIWKAIGDQIAEISMANLKAFFKRQGKDSKKKGRGKEFSAQAKRKVLQYSHGRCMFEGCGLDLEIDDLTGYSGNFGYLAHNVGSSEFAARGGKEISELLSDDPRNILLLCDKHHRLIDKVAAADYPAPRLSEMRRNFKRTADLLLGGLSYEPLPAYAILWPVGGHNIGSPTELQISQALSTIKARPEGPINILSDNNELLMAMKSNHGWSLLPSLIDSTAEKILQQTRGKQYRAALFAFGTMPALIGLGAKLGNKTHITPVLRFRDSGTWAWPLERPRGNSIRIKMTESLEETDIEIAITLSLTARPPQFDAFVEKNNLKEISIEPSDGVYGNRCIGHPEDGVGLMNEIHKLLHQLMSKYRIKKLHLLPCASNAACIFAGMGIDNHHPECVVYDFESNTMVPRLIINPCAEGAQLVPALSD